MTDFRTDLHVYQHAYNHIQNNKIKDAVRCYDELLLRYKNNSTKQIKFFIEHIYFGLLNSRYSVIFSDSFKKN